MNSSYNLKKRISNALDSRIKECQKELAVQIVAAVLYTLNVSEEYDKDDVKRFFSALNGTFEDMEGVGFAQKFNCVDLIDLAKERFDIDLEHEIKIQIKDA